MGSLEMLCGIAVIFLAIYYYLTSIYDFWKSRDIRGPKPIPIVGNYKDVMLNKKCEGDYFKDIYDEYKDESMIGIFIGVTPALIVKDPDLIKDILIKDFSKFGNKTTIVNKNTDLLSRTLIALEYKRWRPLRIRLSPAFTSSKIKEMFPLISECADYLEQYIEKLVSKNEPIDCCQVTAKYTTDVIGKCAFGIEMNALLDKDSEFRKIGKVIFLATWSNTLRYRIKEIFPWLGRMLSYIIPNIKQMEINHFFVRFVKEIMNYRDTNNVIRHNFIDILREIKKNPDKVGDISK
ncbi:Cytochrome P450 6k1 [Camponotus floridanus]|uniref:Cytochrome P450 6k1 n=1 Tax=Camponotus floridanus TaxID=104421 RepID=E2AF54_CAMFO|nr:Cytochrome P450 6k1 [Camponotus floridanus]